MSILPKILDLLVQSSSIDEHESTVASSLLKQYQGQSLIRPFRNASSDGNRERWNFALIAPGGSSVVVSSTSSNYRFVLLFSPVTEYRFINLDTDPRELEPLVSLFLKDLNVLVSDKYSAQVSVWVNKAAEVGGWWVREQD